MTHRRRWISLAAFLALLFGGGAYVSSHPNGPPRPHPTPSVTASPVAVSPVPVGSDPCQAGVICVLNPNVTQATIRTTICVSGWTATVRPPASYTSALKVQQMQQLGLPGTPQDYEEDHRVPLELGGAPSDPHNLTPESHTSSGTKDSAENAAKASVCSGSKTLAQAQSEFVAKWLTPWPGYRIP